MVVCVNLHYRMWLALGVTWCGCGDVTVCSILHPIHVPCYTCVFYITSVWLCVTSMCSVTFVCSVLHLSALTVYIFKNSLFTRNTIILSGAHMYLYILCLFGDFLFWFVSGRICSRWKNYSCTLNFLKGGSSIATSPVLEESPDPRLYCKLYALLPCLLWFLRLYCSDYLCMTWITCMCVLFWNNGQIKTNSSSSSINVGNLYIPGSRPVNWSKLLGPFQNILSHFFDV